MTSLSDCRVALVLAGGNALGAYQAGVYEALHDGGVTLDWVVGTSAGAANGAIMAGNAREDRLDRLRAFWRPDERMAWSGWYGEAVDTWRRSGEVVATLLAGRSGMFGPLGTALHMPDTPGLYDTAPLGRTLSRLVDFDRLNRAEVRFTAQAVTLDSGEEAWFDNHVQVLGPDHIRASSALPPAFPPVTIDDVTYVDGGLSANLPLDPVLGEPSDRPLLCIAVDLLPLAKAHDPAIGSMIARTQDLIFAAQSRRTIAAWRNRYASDADLADRAVTLAHLTYAGQQREVAGKAMDFSGASVRQRWEAGWLDGEQMLDRLRDGRVPLGRGGLHCITMGSGDGQ